jgi:hypothetical protein
MAALVLCKYLLVASTNKGQGFSGACAIVKMRRAASACEKYFELGAIISVAAPQN